MRRLLLDKLLLWKARPRRKPLLIDGARQTGKTYLLQQLLGKDFQRLLRIDFLERPELADAFAGSLAPKDIINNLELLTGQPFNPSTDLLILDEIGECQRAVTSLKYFAEQAADIHVAASGSNIGLLNNFPVGKVEQYNLRPLTFYEFILASKEELLIRALEQENNSLAAHQKLFDRLTDYFFTGGMPEVVHAWYEHADASILARTEHVVRLQQNLIEGYLRDFGKYGNKINASLIESVFRSVPAQLSLVQDESVKRFRFKEVEGKKSRYAEYESAITWLEKSRLILKNYSIDGMAKTPLAAYQVSNKVKLFLFDIGLLSRMLNLGYQQIKQQAYEYKGYIAENFVQQELVAQNIDPTHSWQDARAEIEFILSDSQGNIIPVEVKSGKRTRAKSLQSYIMKCNPIKTIKLSGAQGSSPLEKQHIVLPLYFAGHITKKYID